MDGDAYRDMSHAEMQQVIWRKVAGFASYANIEHRLSNGKIADVYYQVGEVRVIVEVKTIVRDSLIKAAWKKYHTVCDYLVIASPPQLIHQDEPPRMSGWPNDRVERIGFWWVEWTGITEIRPACRLDVKTPGHEVVMSRASSPFTVIAAPGCTANEP
jgi:DNA repair protein MmcB-like